MASLLLNGLGVLLMLAGGLWLFAMVRAYNHWGYRDLFIWWPSFIAYIAILAGVGIVVWA